jgi:signal transduction histidine kinase
MDTNSTSVPARILRGMSIRSRLTVLVIAATLITGLTAGLAGAWAAQLAVNRKYTEDAARNAAHLVGELHLPHSPRLARTLASIFGGNVAFVDDDGTVLADSFEQPVRDAFGEFLAAHGHSGRVRLANTAVRACSAPLGGAGKGIELWLLVPEATLRQARWRVLTPFLLVSLLATLVAAVLGGRVARATVRPIARLGDELQQLAKRLEDGEWGLGQDSAATVPAGQRRTEPREVALLAEAFQRLLDDLQQARLRLAESSRLAAVGKLSASVAHELRNPLAGIRMNAQVLAHALAREGRADPSLDLIVKETDRLSLRLEELLGVATGSRPLRSPPQTAETVALSDVRDAVAGLVGSQFQQAGVALRCEGDFGLAVQAHADDVRRILLNLLLNALEVSSPDDTVSLRVDADDDRVRLTVTDQGGGIDPEIGDVFAPFTTSKPEGVGLGLAISRELAERSGGQLACRNGDGGAAFALSLPRAASPPTNRESNP